MGTTTSATNAQIDRPEITASELRPLARVIRDNLSGGDCPLDYSASLRDSITGLMGYLMDHYELPEPVGLELEAALTHVALAEVHLKKAAVRCS